MMVPIRTPDGILEPKVGQGIGGYAVLRVLTGDLSGGSPSIFKGALLAAATPSPSPSIDPADSASALPDWLLWALFGLVGFVVLAMFALNFYNLRSAYGASRTDKNSQSAGTLATSSQPGIGTTRTTLAIVGFSLLGVGVIAAFGLSGQGVRDLRNQIIGAVTSLVAVIAGFYFGARTAQSSAPAAGPTTAAPGLAPDPKNPNPQFTVGKAGTYTPVVTGTPPPAVSVAGALPSGLTLDVRTGAITGTPAPDTARQYPVTLTASNGISPDATLNLTLEVSGSQEPVPTPPVPTPPVPTPPVPPG